MRTLLVLAALSSLAITQSAFAAASLEDYVRTHDATPPDSQSPATTRPVTLTQTTTRHTPITLPAPPPLAVAPTHVAGFQSHQALAVMYRAHSPGEGYAFIRYDEARHLCLWKYVGHDAAPVSQDSLCRDASSPENESYADASSNRTSASDVPQAPPSAYYYPQYYGQQPYYGSPGIVLRLCLGCGRGYQRPYQQGYYQQRPNYSGAYNRQQPVYGGGMNRGGYHRFHH